MNTVSYLRHVVGFLKGSMYSICYLMQVDGFLQYDVNSVSYLRQVGGCVQWGVSSDVNTELRRCSEYNIEYKGG